MVRTVLLFEFLALIEYWVSPLFLGVDNFVGLWDVVGYVLFAVLVATLLVGVVGPLLPRLRAALVAPRRRWAFVGLVSASLVVGLFATATFRFEAVTTAPGGGPWSTLWAPVSTPFGTWSTFEFAYAPWNLNGAMNIEVLTLLGLLSMLWASAVVLGMARPADACPAPPASAPRKPRALALLVWGPLGFMTGCSACTPIFVAGLGIVAPGSALAAYNALPLVPWIGLAGLLYLASLVLTLRFVRRVTGPATPLGAAPGEAPVSREAAA